MKKNQISSIFNGALGKSRTRDKAERAGFTLIELLVVISIIGLLASVVLVSLNSARSKARDAKRVADVKQLATALTMYFNDCSGYPLTANFNSALVSSTPKYVSVIPSAPLPADNGCGTGNTYTYANTGTTYTSPSTATACTVGQVASGYTLTFCLGANTGSFVDGADANATVDCTLSHNGITCS